MPSFVVRVVRSHDTAIRNYAPVARNEWITDQKLKRH